MKSFHLKIATPDRLVFDGQAESLLVRTAEGDAEIMAGHADFLSALAIGRAKLTSEGKQRLAAVAGGYISVIGGEVSLVCTTFEFADEIDIARAKASKEKAEQALSATNDDKTEALLRARLARATARISAWELNK